MRNETIPFDIPSGFDLATATPEGWTLTEYGRREDGRPLVQLHRLDDPPDGRAPFVEDHDVWAHVVRQARSGSRLHQDALRRIDSIERACIEIAFGPV